ncbi:hypothetical protein ACFL0Z_00030 [Patescibacteria group bacterium]
MGYISWEEVVNVNLVGSLMCTYECNINMRSLIEQVTLDGDKVRIITAWTEIWLPAKEDEPGRWERDEGMSYVFANQVKCLRIKGGFWFRIPSIGQGYIYLSGKFTLEPTLEPTL